MPDTVPVIVVRSNAGIFVLAAMVRHCHTFLRAFGIGPAAYRQRFATSSHPIPRGALT